MQTRKGLSILLLILSLFALLVAGCTQEPDYTNKPIPTGTPNPDVPKIGAGGGGGASAPAVQAEAAPK